MVGVTRGVTRCRATMAVNLIAEVKGGVVRLRLIGTPHIAGGDEVRPIRGFQVWALLARVLLSERPLTRRELAAELFPNTADPSVRCAGAWPRYAGPSGHLAF